jgi:hypothetical protein
MIGWLTRRVKGAWWWVQAFDLAARGQHEAAIQLIRAIDELGTFSRTHPCRAYSMIVKGRCFLHLQRYKEAADTLAEIQRQLNSAGVGSSENRYLRCYVALLGKETLSGLRTNNPAEDTHVDAEYHDLFTPNLGSVDPTKVPPHIKRKFPMHLPASSIA